MCLLSLWHMCVCVCVLERCVCCGGNEVTAVEGRGLLANSSCN